MGALVKVVKPPKFWEIAKEVNFVPEAINALWKYNKEYDCEFGGGRRVRICPGLGAGDYSTVLLRNFLNKRGFDALGWGLGVNTGYHEDLNAQLNKIAHDDYYRNGEKAYWVGHSLGGIDAMEVARNNPDMIGGVVTLDSPINFGAQGVNVIVKFLYRILAGHWVEDVSPKILQRMYKPMPVPFTAIASKASGVVAIETATTHHAGPIYENIILDDVTHCGMIASDKVFQILANRLSQPDNVKLWRKYNAPLAIEYKPWFSPVPAKLI